MRALTALVLALLLLPAVARTQTPAPVSIAIDTTATGSPWKPTWNWFGADEPNYLTTPDGRALLRELSHLSSDTPIYFRPHNLLTSGNGTPALKWGSTGVYKENASGQATYDWTITDQLFDTMVHNGITPFVEIGFTPELLSPHPTPYQHSFPQGSVFTGWSYPPKDDAKWAELITAWAAHLRSRYGPQVDHWRFEVWNEPDIDYFHGTPQQYFHLYDLTAAALERAIPHVLVGGPAVTGPRTEATFLKAFLEHCAHGTNTVTGNTGAPLTFISFHPKGAPHVVDGQAQMGIHAQLHAMQAGFNAVAAFPQFAHLPIILSESDPEGCAACEDPANTYRNSEAYGTAVLEATARSQQMAQAAGVTLEGAVNWSFLFPDQPIFAQLRSLATAAPGDKGEIVDKPVLDTLRMLAALGGTRLPTVFDGAAASTPGTAKVATLTSAGPHTDTGAFATVNGRLLQILLWSYSDTLAPNPSASTLSDGNAQPQATPQLGMDPATQVVTPDTAPPTLVTLNLAHLPRNTSVHVQRFLVDSTHSNAFVAWKAQGSPEQPDKQQIAAMQRAAEPQSVEKHAVETDEDGNAALHVDIPRNAATLLQIHLP